MSRLLPRIPFEDLSPSLQEILAPRVERLGYLGEFFQVAAHQPPTLAHFIRLTQELKEALPDDLTELVALSVASLLQNDYERVQHERLSLKKGLTEEWVRGVLELKPDEVDVLDESQRAVQKLVIAAVSSGGRDSGAYLEAVAILLSPEQTVAILLLIGRYVMHAIVSNALALQPPVSSPLG